MHRNSFFLTWEKLLRDILPLWPASRSHCWTLESESVWRIWQRSSNTWEKSPKPQTHQLVLKWRGWISHPPNDTWRHRSPSVLDGEGAADAPRVGNVICDGGICWAEGWVSRFRLNTESFDEHVLPQVGPESRCDRAICLVFVIAGFVYQDFYHSDTHFGFFLLCLRRQIDFGNEFFKFISPGFWKQLCETKTNNLFGHVFFLNTKGWKSSGVVVRVYQISFCYCRVHEDSDWAEKPETAQLPFGAHGPWEEDEEIRMRWRTSRLSLCKQVYRWALWETERHTRNTRRN